jgi:hypothetical protein
MNSVTSTSSGVVTTLDERAIRILIARELGYRLKDITFEWDCSNGTVIGVKIVEKPNWQHQ